jgi:hypothetical protein
LVCANRAAAAFAATSAPTSMVYNFHIFNNPRYENDPNLNFTLTITDEGSWWGRQKVGFKFDNNSIISSSITDIYFDARPDTGSSLLFSNVSIFEGSGVDFSKSANPTTLPGGAELTPPFDRRPEYSADSDSPVSHNGINPNEWLKLVFMLNYNRTIDDVIAEIAAGGSTTDKNLRVGIHIQSLPKDIHYGWYCCCPPPDYSDSASAINCTKPITPEPATICLLGLGALSLIRRKKIERRCIGRIK